MTSDLISRMIVSGAYLPILIEVGIPNSVSCILCDDVPYAITYMYRPPDKRAYLKIFFFFLFLNQNMWVLKRTTPNHKVMDKKIIAVYSHIDQL